MSGVSTSTRLGYKNLTPDKHQCQLCMVFKVLVNDLFCAACQKRNEKDERELAERIATLPQIAKEKHLKEMKARTAREFPLNRDLEVEPCPSLPTHVIHKNTNASRNY